MKRGHLSQFRDVAAILCETGVVLDSKGMSKQGGKIYVISKRLSTHNR